MKISLAWVFDHIQADWKTVNIAELVEHFNKTVAEVEGFERKHIDWDRCAVGRVQSLSSNKVKVTIAERQLEVVLPTREVAVDALYLIFQTSGVWNWAMYKDIGSEKDGYLPSLLLTYEQEAGDWRSLVEYEDYVLELDNKSVTNRPDMWGHRGFAREVAAMLGEKMVPKEDMLAHVPCKQTAKRRCTHDGITIDISASDTCTYFSGIKVAHIGEAATSASLWMLQRLVRIGSRAHGLAIDTTNYVLHDWGHPMHAFDADALEGDLLNVRDAHQGEKLSVLDGETVELAPHDCVVADAAGPVSLAGIMGGTHSSVTASTQNIFLEAAHFKATPIRRTALRLKKRTDSSARFEKGLDPHQAVSAIKRYLYLLTKTGLTPAYATPIISVGQLPTIAPLSISHEVIEKRLGVSLSQKRVIDILQKLECRVVADKGVYAVTVPTFRATKDLTIAEDLIEEIGRFVGYENIAPTLPPRMMRPIATKCVTWRRALKQHLAYAMNMKEVSNYAMYDQSLLRELSYSPDNSVRLANPLSENWQVLVTSLIPHLLKNVMHNKVDYEELRFYEWNRDWQKTKDSVVERRVCSGIFYHANKVDFYTCKAQVTSLFERAGVEVQWKKIADEQALPVWSHPHKTACLLVNNHVLGYAGMINQEYMNRVAPGQAFVFEIDLDVLYGAPQRKVAYKEPSKYQSVELDISVLAPLHVTVEQCEQTLSAADVRVQQITLMDTFQKDDWGQQRSLTFKCIVQDYEKTLESDDIHAIQARLHKAIENLGATVR